MEDKFLLLNDFKFILDEEIKKVGSNINNINCNNLTLDTIITATDNLLLRYEPIFKSKYELSEEELRHNSLYHSLVVLNCFVSNFYERCSFCTIKLFNVGDFRELLYEYFITSTLNTKIEKDVITRFVGDCSYDLILRLLDEDATYYGDYNDRSVTYIEEKDNVIKGLSLFNNYDTSKFKEHHKYYVITR